MSTFDKLRNNFLKIFGDIKVYKFPFFILYDPGSYLVKGADIRKVLETIEPGDILVRGYKNYLDGYFIPGFFSHAGLYLGETKKSDLPLSETQENLFYEGKQVVIHSMAEGVFMEDILNFCRCDYLMILRRNNKIEPTIDLVSDFKNIYKKAIGNLGKSYDFEFDFFNNDSLSCTELVQVCYADILKSYDVLIKERKVLFKKRQMLIPDDFVTNKFDFGFISKSVNEKMVEAITKRNQIIPSQDATL